MKTSKIKTLNTTDLYRLTNKYGWMDRNVENKNILARNEQLLTGFRLNSSKGDIKGESQTIIGADEYKYFKIITEEARFAKGYKEKQAKKSEYANIKGLEDVIRKVKVPNVDEHVKNIVPTLEPVFKEPMFTEPNITKSIFEENLLEQSKTNIWDGISTLEPNMVVDSNTERFLVNFVDEYNNNIACTGLETKKMRILNLYDVFACVVSEKDKCYVDVLLAWRMSDKDRVNDVDDSKVSIKELFNVIYDICVKPNQSVDELTQHENV